MASEDIKDAKAFSAFLFKWKQQLDVLQMNKKIIVPGGGVGKNSSECILYIIEKQIKMNIHSLFVIEKVELNIILVMLCLLHINSNMHRYKTSS